MNWKMIIKPINVGWLSWKPKARNSSFRPIKIAKRKKHRKEFICTERGVEQNLLYVTLASY